MNRKRGFWLGLWVVLVVVTGVLAFGSGDGNRGYGPWGGWGHMGGWGDGYQSQSEPGWFGMGPGMMGDAESGYGWGRGRFHSGKGYAMPDGSYGSMLWLPQNMTEEQAKKSRELLAEADRTSSKLLQQRQDAQARMSRLYSSEKRDWNAIRAAATELAELSSQQMKSALEMQQKIDGLLTDNQRQEMTRDMQGYGWRGRQ